MNIDLEKVTRFEVIDHRGNAEPFGRIVTIWDRTMAVTLELQDGGRTLKVFLDTVRTVEGT